ncbi:MAG: TlpA family protein disulfide reductase [Planctomycetales bacterium]|nr:TlpA family protein disulfide reductase [Planctomycetales bacterium]
MFKSMSIPYLFAVLLCSQAAPFGASPATGAEPSDNTAASTTFKATKPTASVTSRTQGITPLPLTLSPLQNHNGLEDIQTGKVIVVDVWASWCGNCYAAMEKFQSVAKANPQWTDKVEFIAATVDTSPTAAIAAVQRQGWNSTRHCKADLAELNRLGIRRVPTLLIISKEGRIVKVTSPFNVNIENEISRLLS